MLENVLLKLQIYPNHYETNSDFEERVDDAVSDFLSCPELRQHRLVGSRGFEIMAGTGDTVVNLCSRMRLR